MTSTKNSRNSLAKQIEEILDLGAARPKKGEIKPVWLRFTEETNALDYLEKAAFFIREADSDTTGWKWVILCLHGALYGFAICAVRGTNSYRVTFTTKGGQRRLISFHEALKRCQDPDWMQMTIMSKTLKLTHSQADSIKRLKKDFRNYFEHYVPTAWSIEIHGMPQIAMDVLDVIRFLSVETGNYTHLNQSQIRKVKSLVFQCKKLLKNSKLYQDLQKTT